MFDWSKEEEQSFYQANIEKIVTKLKTIKILHTETKRRRKPNFYYIWKK